MSGSLVKRAFECLIFKVDAFFVDLSFIKMLLNEFRLGTRTEFSAISVLVLNIALSFCVTMYSGESVLSALMIIKSANTLINSENCCRCPTYCNIKYSAKI